jgi:hypothetical protein
MMMTQQLSNIRNQGNGDGESWERFRRLLIANGHLLPGSIGPFKR